VRGARKTVLEAPEPSMGLSSACTPPVPACWAGGVSFLPSARKADPDIECQLQVRNLSEQAGEDDLRALFAVSGDVLAVRIIRDPHTGASRGYGFVMMSAQSEADTAISRLDDHPLFGLKLKVSLVKARTLRADFFK
jgi:RNA recognition motif-containing protein